MTKGKELHHQRRARSAKHAVDNRHGCSFCDEFFEEKIAPLHAQLMPGVSLNRVLDGDDEFVILPTIGPLRVGHVLVVPRRHSVSALALTVPLVRLYETWVLRAACHLSALYGTAAVAFEHGSGPSTRIACERAGACIEHAHVHVLPNATGFLDSVLTDFDEPWSTSDELTALRDSSKESSYLLLGEQHSGGLRWHSLANPQCVPSQYLRRAYSDAAGQSAEWNWRVDPARSVFDQTMRDWHGRDPQRFATLRAARTRVHRR